MSRGLANRTPISGIDQLGTLIGGMQSNEAIALGSLRDGLPQRVDISTRRALNRATAPNIISRTADNITFRSGQQGFVLLDYDTKAMPESVVERLNQEGGFWAALCSVLPGLGRIAHIRRASTSAGLYRKDTGAQVPGSHGLHVYLGVQNVADSARFLKTLHDRCWLAGFGWMMVGAGGQLLERSIIDRMVGAPERLVFEGAPILDEPLAQSTRARQPDVREGDWLETQASCPPLSVLDKAKLDDLRAKAAHRLTGEAAAVREVFIEARAEGLAKRSGMSVHTARGVLGKQCGGVLLPSVILPFDNPDLAEKTVADVLSEPAAFEGETLADPLEGIDYGRCKARIMRSADGTPWINSFAHGRTIYELKLDASAIRAAMSAADAGDVVQTFIRLALLADIGATEEEDLIGYARDRCGSGIRSIGRTLKKARQARVEKEAAEERQRRLAKRNDPRPMLDAPALDAPWLPEMDVLTSVQTASDARVPPVRSINLEATLARRVKFSNLHAFFIIRPGE
jgi:hypothetical protein